MGDETIGAMLKARVEKYGDRMPPSHNKAMQDILDCRTDVMGGELYWCPQRKSNPRRRLERAVSWASRRWGHNRTYSTRNRPKRQVSTTPPAF